MPDHDLESEPLVSVIIPTYNRPDYLKDALKSALQQTYRNIEIIVSDNASPDNPQPWIEALNDPRIQVYRQEQNVGMFANVQSAFLRAKGKYMASLLDDDVWEPDFLDKLVPPLERYPSVAIAFCDHYMVSATGEIDIAATEACSRANHRHDLPEGVYYPMAEYGLINGAISPAMAGLIRREAVDWSQIPAEADVLWDMYVNYVCCRDDWASYYCPDKLTRVREHAQSETQQSGARNVQAKLRKGRAQIFCFNTLLADDRLKDYHPIFRQRWAHANTTLGIGLIRDRKPVEARPYLWRSLRSQFKMRTFVAIVVSYLPYALARRF
ncbi:MAG TPA: glycosyltransferase family 2 protein [Candidatus Obscuribacterales bacterium]